MKASGFGKQHSQPGADGTAEPSEERIRRYLLIVVAFILPPLLLFFYFNFRFAGLANPDALDYAHLGRNISSGRGFVTYILRPLALTHGDNPLRQPDVTHGPLYPFILALAFGAFGAKEIVAAAVSGLFYLLTIPVLYLLGARAFSRSVGVIAALVYMVNALMLEYAASGLHITLYVFLTSALVLALYNIAARAQDREAGQVGRLPKALLILAGVLAGALYLTDPFFFWAVPVGLGSVVWLNRSQRLPAAGWFLLPLALLVVPWLARNWTLTGNPVYGLRGLEVWMQTPSYPGFDAYRMAVDELVPGGRLFQEVLKKSAIGFGQIIRSLPEATTSWVLGFFIVGLFFRFPNEAAGKTRRILLFCLLGLVATGLIFRVDGILFMSVVPVACVFGAALLVHLAQGAQMRRPAQVALTLVAASIVAYPLFSDMLLVPRARPSDEAATARSLSEVIPPGEVTLSDQPWVLAWHADRPALWIPKNDQNVKAYRGRFAGTRWLYLTPQARGFSQDWNYLYDVFRQWNELTVLARLNQKAGPKPFAISGKGHPLREALAGFTPVPPSGNGLPDAVLATVPSSKAAAKLPQPRKRQLARSLR
jgi:4-amino-4-deoxy-L-arabinose transferase-like glycosyltransferase